MTATLEHANRVKHARAALLHRMYLMAPRQSHLFAADLLEDPPEVLATLTLERFLRRVRAHEPRNGEQRRAAPSASRVERRYVKRILGVSAVDGGRRLGELSESELLELAFVLRVRAPRGRVRVVRERG